MLVPLAIELLSFINNLIIITEFFYFFLGATNFAHEFATGYLIGEVLEKYGLQADFSQFSQSRSVLISISRP